MTLVEKALALATDAHAGQVRKDGTPYIEHPIAVQRMVAEYGFDEETQAAALVHDVLEDTNVSPEQLSARLGERVLALIVPLTEDGALEREERNRRYVEAVRNAPIESKAIFTADKVHNLRDLLMLYDKEKEALWTRLGYTKDLKERIERLRLAMLRETWEHPLVEEYAALVEQLEARA